MVVDDLHLFQLVVRYYLCFQHRSDHHIAGFDHLLQLFVLLELHIDQSHLFFLCFRVHLSKVADL